MAQQINLFNPILLTPKRYFSALAMVQAVSAVALAIAAMSIWALMQTSHLRTQWEAGERERKLEREQLEMAVARLPVQKDDTALEQELRALQQAIAQRQQMLGELTRGLVSDGRSHSALLRLVAQTTPAPAWLSQLRLAYGRIELSGSTLEPAVLQPWLATLAANPLLAGQHLAAVKVERVDENDTNVATWSFTVLSDSPVHGDGASPGARR